MTDTANGPIRVLELRSVRGTGGGPEKTILLGSARSDPARFPVTVCYIRDLRDAVFEMGERARALGLDYVETRERHSFDWTIWPALRALVADRRIDIIHAHDYKTDLLALLLARATGAIPLATVHGWIHNTWKERIYYQADTRLLSWFPAVIAVSGPIRDTLIARGADPARVHRIPNGVDHQRYRRIAGVRSRMRHELGLADDTIVIGAVGRLSREKRFDLLLESAAAATSRPTVLLVGDGPERDDLGARIAALGLGERARLVGQRPDIPDLLQAMDIYVQTSDTEGIPNAVLEAMAAEVAVVATDVGGTGELITGGEHGLLVPKGDVARIAAAIDATAADAAATASRVAAARARIERELSFDARMSRVEAIYSALHARAGSSRAREAR